MGFLQEGECFRLKNAGDEARSKGLLKKRKVLKCPYRSCDRVKCVLEVNPLVRTIPFASADIPIAAPKDRFYKRLQRHVDMVAASQ